MSVIYIGVYSSTKGCSSLYHMRDFREHFHCTACIPQVFCCFFWFENYVEIYLLVFLIYIGYLLLNFFGFLGLCVTACSHCMVTSDLLVSRYCLRDA